MRLVVWFVRRGSINAVESVLVDGVLDDDRAALVTTVPSAISARGKGGQAIAICIYTCVVLHAC